MDQVDDTKKEIEDVKLKFQDDIFSALNASEITDEEKGALLVKMLDLVDSRCLDKVLDRVDEAARKEIEKIVEDDDAAAFEQFIEKNVPDYAELYENEAEKLRQELIIDITQ